MDVSSQFNLYGSKLRYELQCYGILIKMSLKTQESIFQGPEYRYFVFMVYFSGHEKLIIGFMAHWIAMKYMTLGFMSHEKLMCCRFHGLW